MRKEKFVLGTALFFFLFSGCCRPIHSDPVFFAHRGDSIDHVEHSFASYDAAIEKGARYIDQDLELSADGTLYVSHDPDVKRLTGADGRLVDMDDAQINALKTANGEPIHTLASVFERYGKSVMYVPEIRNEKGQTEALISLVKKFGLAHNIIVQVWTIQDAQQIKEAFKEMPVLYFVNSPLDFYKGAACQDVDILCFNKKMMTCPVIKMTHQCHKKAAFWTLDTAKEIEWAANLGADIYFTDDTALGIRMEKMEDRS